MLKVHSAENGYSALFSAFVSEMSDINTTHSTCLDTLELITYADFFPKISVHGNKLVVCSFLEINRIGLLVAGNKSIKRREEHLFVNV